MHQNITHEYLILFPLEIVVLLETETKFHCSIRESDKHKGVRTISQATFPPVTLRSVDGPSRNITFGVEIYAVTIRPIDTIYMS